MPPNKTQGAARRLSRLPSLNALRTFEAAARHCSFKAAAEEICVSQAAISRQIQVLETYFNQPLFERHHRKVELTAAGRQLYLSVNSAFQQLMDTSADLLGQRAGSHLTLASTTSFSRLWLLPRLKAFQSRYPDIQLHLVSSERSPELDDGFDAAITLGIEEHPDYRSDYLFSEEIFPVCTPEFLAKHGPLNGISDLFRLPLLDLSAEHWKARRWLPVDWMFWFQQFSVTPSEPLSVMSFSEFPLLLDAIREGLGAGLGWRHLLLQDLDSGQLLPLLPDRYKAEDRRHYVVYRQHDNHPQLLELRRWLLEQTAPLRDESRHKD